MKYYVVLAVLVIVLAPLVLGAVYIIESPGSNGGQQPAETGNNETLYIAHQCDTGCDTFYWRVYL